MKRTPTVATAAVAALALAACGGGESEQAGGGTDEVTVGVIPIVDVAPIYLGQQQGFFAERDIELTLETSQGGAAIVPGVASGQFDFGFSNMTSLLTAQTQDLPLQVTSAGVATTGDVDDDFGAIVAPSGSGIDDASDLSGRSVAVNTLNNIGDTTVRHTVEQAGGDPSDIEFVELGFPDMPAAVQEGRVDAAWMVEPFVTIATDQDAEVVASNFAATHEELAVAAYFTSTELAESDPDLVDRFTEAMNASLDYAQDNPEQARDILGSYTDIDSATAESLTLPEWPTEINEESVQLLADLAVEHGLVDGEPDVGALLP
ncbi:NitT/TauT family transport system substrate-binding protein [Haloechinothrix alba]|uniref:NitT/TauT family transport system substrate-binding protein n=1 Tax=Haloechinothrix alba TaxID=664784 RepID=A0A238WS26_9PSEU|nr:ABC transporter substrate-binding protein [Haloechinothrix alba]SNR49337.1 NitT/TauT family transport system substrate-binding protein [Haloechinothrix alba]